MTLTTTLIILVICLLAEAFFSGAEIALISADKVALRTRAERGSDEMHSPVVVADGVFDAARESSDHDGHDVPGQGREPTEDAANVLSTPRVMAPRENPRRSRAVRRFLDDPSQLISAALVGTNICVVLSTVVATLALLPRFPRHAELFSLALVTPLVLVFGEIVPKSIFQHHANRWAPTLISILSWFRLAFLPVVVLGSRFSSMLLRIFGVRESQGFVGREELRLLITLPSRIGEDSISIQEKQMISRIFAFSETEVEEVMVPLSEVTALPILSSLEDVAREIADKAHTRIPVYSERVDQIVGIVHAFDVLRAEPFVDVETISWPPIFVPESQLAVDTLVRLKREGQGMAVVVDEYGGATGVVTVEDIIEEIVGEIQDEYDEEGGLVRAGPDGTTLAAGRASVESVNALADLDLPIQAEDYETIAGLVLERAKKIPKEGARFAIAGVTITVTKATERSIEEVRIRQEGKGRGQ